MKVVTDLRTRIAFVRANAFWRLAAPVRSFLLRRKRVRRWVRPVIARALPRLEPLLGLVQGDPVKRYQAWVGAYDTIDEADLLAMQEEASGSAEQPLLSLVVPVERASAATLEALLGSLYEQVYERWEADFIGAPVGEDATSLLARSALRDSRLRFSDRCAKPLAEAWNYALRSATGAFSVFVDPSVALRPHALFLVAQTIERNSDTVLVYADEDVIDGDGARSAHYFKPDWNEALLCSQNYLGGFVAFRRSVALEVGGCRDELDGDCAWGLVLQVTARAPEGTIHHLPFVLSHRHGQHSPEPRLATEQERSTRAHEERLARVGRQVQLEPVGDSSYRTRYALPKEPPKVSVIVPSTGKLELLAPCLDGVLDHTSYADLDVLLVVNETYKDMADRRDYLDALTARPRVRVLYHEDRPFNFSWANNWGVGHARGEVVCFLNDDTEVIASDWLPAMVGQILQDRVAAVGAMLYYPDDRIQHAGVVLGAGGIAAHNWSGARRGSRGYHDRALIDQDVSCVTAACMLMRRDVFLSIGGYDEALGVAYNDVDICLRLAAAGWRIVWTPSAELYHRESVSTGPHDFGEREDEWEVAWSLMRRRWSEQLDADPHYSPNLSLDPLQLWEPAFPPRVTYPWRPGSSNLPTDTQATAVSGGSGGAS
jgi:GT2 family glycosyltransferase